MGKGGDVDSTINTYKKVTMDELRNHCEPQNAWIAYNGKVYDVSNWYDHPGGSVIFSWAGEDCTDIMHTFAHPITAFDGFEKNVVGELDTVTPYKMNKNKLSPEEQNAFEKKYRAFRFKLKTMGLFKTNLWYYLRLILLIFGIAGLSIGIIMTTQSFVAHMFAALVMGLFWQQCAWLGHDFCHQQVFQNREFNNWMGIFVMNGLQGLSMQWWKIKHYTHHAITNVESSTSECVDGDPDMDTMPYLAWTIRMVEQARNSSWIRYQALYYFPILLLARIAWCHQGLAYAFGGGGWGQRSVVGAHEDIKRLRYPTLEKVGMVGHYVAVFFILNLMPFFHAVMYYLVAQMFAGLLIAFVIGLGHNGMSVYHATDRPDFWRLQVSTTRNILGNGLVQWFCGGLGNQVDHHLFPTIPRHNLDKVNKMVQVFCAENQVTYHATNIWDGTIEVLAHLDKIAVQFATEFPEM